MLLCTIWLIAIGRGRRLGMRLVVRGQRLGDLGQPFVQQLGRTRVQRGHGADDAGLALRDHQLGVADDEQRRADDGQAQLAQRGGKGTTAHVQKGLQGHGESAFGAVDDRVADALGLAEDVVAVEARRGDLGGHEGDVVARWPACRRPPAARGPVASRPRGCRPASGRAPSRRTRRWGSSLVLPAMKADGVEEGHARRGREALREGLGVGLSARGGQRLLGGLDARHDGACAAVPPSRAVLRPTKSLAWMAVVPS